MWDLVGLSGYALIGIVWARSQAVRLQRLLYLAKTERDCLHPWYCRMSDFRHFDRALGRALTVYGMFWPLVGVGHAIGWGARGLYGWMTGPIKKEREKITKLREEANSYKEALNSPTITLQEKELLQKLINTYTKQADGRRL